MEFYQVCNTRRSGACILLHSNSASPIGRSRRLPARKPLGELLVTLRRCGWAPMLPVIILVGLRMGVFTPTEAGVVAAVYALFVATVIYRDMKLSQLYGIFKQAAKTTAIVMFLVAAAMVSAWLITVADLPGKVVGMLEPFLGSPITLMVMIMVLVM